MKKNVKRIVAIALCLVMMLGIIPFSKVSASAVNSIKTVDEAVAWLNSQGGASYNFGDFYDDDGNFWGGTQCVEFVRAYVNWLVNGNAWSDTWNGPTGNGDTIWQNPLWSRLGWSVYYNTADFLPQPGDIFSSGGCHTGVVISSDVHSAVIADSNAGNNDFYDGDPVRIHSITWQNADSYKAYGATHFIRPNFSAPHSHSYTTYVYNLASHPHYKCYKCSCGEIKADTTQPVFNSSCEECLNTVRPNKPTVIGINSNYSTDDTVTFSWSATSNTTHYNIFIDILENESYKTYENVFNYNDLSISRKLTAGTYRVCVASYNSEYWELDDSDWLHSSSEYFNFTVTESAPITASITYNANGGENAPDTQVFNKLPEGWTDNVLDGVEPSEQKLQYRYRTKQLTEASTETLNGWTKYDELISGYGEWSNWTSNKITATKYKDVKTQNVAATYKTVWHYSRDTGNGLSTYAIGYYGNPEYITLDYRLSVTGTFDGYNCYGPYGTGAFTKRWWNESSEQVVDKAAYTAYASRDINYTFKFFKWSEWSEYSDDMPVASDSIEIESSTVYKYTNSVTLSDAIPVREGYKFVGWSTDETATAEEYSAGDTYYENNDLNLYAVWAVECVHNNTHLINEIPASCTTMGYTGDTVCDDCQKVISTGTEIDMIPHSFHDTLVAPTTTEQGYTLHTCKCGYSYKDTYTDPVFEDAPQIIASSAKTTAGKQIEVTLSLKNNPGIAGLAVSLKYDASVLTLAESKKGTMFSGFTAGKNFVWDESEDVTTDGILATFVFSVADNAQPGDYVIEAIPRSCINESIDDVTITPVNGIVTVIDYIYGDVNGDEKIDMKDVVLLRQFIVNYDYDTETSSVAVEAGADANGDGNLDMKDVVLLRKYIVNFDYDTGTSSVVLGPQKAAI